MRNPRHLATYMTSVTVAITVLSVTLYCKQARTAPISRVDGTPLSPPRSSTSTVTQKREGLFSNGNAAQWRKEGPQFTRLWKQRKTRNIAPELVALLEDPVFSSRDQVANALGILESPEGEAPLLVEMDKWKKYEKQSREYEKAFASSVASNSVPPARVEEPNAASRFTIKLALGRIRSRNLKGRAKLNCIAKEFDLDYEGVVKVTEKVGQQIHSESPNERHDAIRSENYKIVLAFMDTLYSMGKHGENLNALDADRMTIGPNFQLRLKGAVLSSHEEAKMWLDHATNSKMGIFRPSYLLDIGPVAVELLFERLNDISAHPAKYGISKDDAPLIGLDSLFKAAAQSGDGRAIAVLEKFQNIDNEQVRGDAAQSLNLARQIIANNSL